MTPTIGYPVHAVATYRRWTNPHGCHFTDWTAVCGASATAVGHRPFGSVLDARRLELCTACFPGRNVRHLHPEPREVAS